MKSKRVLLIFTVFVLLSVVCCTPKSEILGGEIIKYNYCLVDDSFTLATCPIILQHKVELITLTGVKSTQTELFHVEGQGFQKEECHQYNGYYVYFLVLKLENNSAGKPINTFIEGLFLDIDGKEFYYETPDFKISNVQFLCEQEGAICSVGEVLHSGVPLLSSQIPTPKRPMEYSYIANKGVTFISLRALDYLEITELFIDGTSIDDANSIHVDAAEDTEHTFRYHLEYVAPANEDSIVRTSKILTFADGGVKKIFVSISGYYIFPSFESYGVINNYIDTLQ
jgi:hypothetical protein